jgi:hypothetical protein
LPLIKASAGSGAEQPMPGAARQAPIEVTVEARGQEIVAGTPWVHERSGQGATFRYIDEYLSSPDSYDLDPAMPKSSRRSADAAPLMSALGRLGTQG